MDDPSPCNFQYEQLEPYQYYDPLAAQDCYGQPDWWDPELLDAGGGWQCPTTPAEDHPEDNSWANQAVPEEKAHRVAVGVRKGRKRDRSSSMSTRHFFRSLFCPTEPRRERRKIQGLSRSKDDRDVRFWKPYYESYSYGPSKKSRSSRRKERRRTMEQDGLRMLLRGGAPHPSAGRSDVPLHDLRHPRFYHDVDDYAADDFDQEFEERMRLKDMIYQQAEELERADEELQRANLTIARLRQDLQAMRSGSHERPSPRDRLIPMMSGARRATVTGLEGWGRDDEIRGRRASRGGEEDDIKERETVSDDDETDVRADERERQNEDIAGRKPSISYDYDGTDREMSAVSCESLASSYDDYGEDGTVSPKSQKPGSLGNRKEVRFSVSSISDHGGEESGAMEMAEDGESIVEAVPV